MSARQQAKARKRKLVSGYAHLSNHPNRPRSHAGARAINAAVNKVKSK